MRILTFTTLYPNAARPRHGVFVEQRLRHLLRSGEVEARVVAPVPWFPSSHPRYGRYAEYARAPALEERHGITVEHPRFPVIPKVGHALAPLLLARGSERTVRRVLEQGGGFDLIDAHFLYPDGVAAVLLAKRLGKPVVVTARGSDVNVVPRHPLARRMILWMAAQASALVTVSSALKSTLAGLGAPEGKITVLRNGVDLETFRPQDRREARRRWGLSRPTLASVGNLIPSKGHHIVLEALALLPEAGALIIGEGQEGDSLRRLAQRLGVADRVRFVPHAPQDELATAYAAADVLVLATAHEGWPNVLLESMACGTPVVATRVGGIPEIVHAPSAGLLVDERTPEAFASAIREVVERSWDRDATRRYAEGFGWEDTTSGQLALFRRVIASARDAP